MKSTHKTGLIGLSVAMALVLTIVGAKPAAAVADHNVQIGLPAYVWPGDPFLEDLKSPVATPIPPSVVIGNIGNGDGDVSLLDNDADVLRARMGADGQNVKMIGYVWTNYGNRSLAAVKASIDAWLAVRNGAVHYDGIFLDQVPTACGTRSKPMKYRNYYRQIREYIWNKIPGSAELVVNNPGLAISDCYLEAGKDTADIFVTFEGSETAYFQTPSAQNGWQGWVGGNIIHNGQYNLGEAYPASRFWHMVYDTTASEHQNVLNAANDRWAGMVTPSDDILPNPWDIKPSYLNDAILYASTL